MAFTKHLTCDVETTLRVIGGRWKVLVLGHLLGRPVRFNALHRLLRGISHRTLVRQLRELQRDGIIDRRVFPEIPPRVEYSLTRLGGTLRPVLQAMHRWGSAYARRTAHVET